MRVSKRLKMIAEHINGKRLIDVGCDHGYLPIYLIKNKKIDKALACDISKQAVEKARENIAKEGFLDKIDTVVSDGLENIDTSDYDSISICGVGATTIINILKNSKEKLKNINQIIISPQSEIQHCIEEVERLDFNIVEENFLEERGKFYPLFVLEKGNKRSFIFGETLIDNIAYKKYILQKQNKLRTILNKVESMPATTQNNETVIENEVLNLDEKEEAVIDLQNSNEIKVEDVINVLEALSPKEYACEWDNIGLLIGDKNHSVKKILVAVEMNNDIVEYAIKQNIDMVVCHHPLIFRKLDRVIEDHFIGRKIIKLIKNDISVYAMHTNFDICGSMGELAAKKLWLGDIKPLVKTHEDGHGIGAIGNIAYVNLKTFSFIVKDTFNLKVIKVYGDMNKLINRVCVVPGSCSMNEIKAAINEKADLIIGGDISHHNGLDALEQGIFVIDAGHYGVEKIFVEFVSNYLKKSLLDIEVVSEECKEKFEWV